MTDRGTFRVHHAKQHADHARVAMISHAVDRNGNLFSVALVMAP